MDTKQVFLFKSYLQSKRICFDYYFSFFTFEDRDDFPNFHRSVAAELTKGHFEEVERFANQQQDNQVRN